MKVKICKAESIGDQKIEDVEISISEPIKRLESLDEHDRYFDREARNLANALWAGLPQGVRVRLTGILIKREVENKSTLGNYVGR